MLDASQNPLTGRTVTWTTADAAVAAVDGIGEVLVTLVWEPGWTKDRMSEDARLALGIF